MPSVLTDGEAAGLGVSTLHERMDNGEYRFRLRHSDGSSYIRTQAAGESGWQKSHLHKYVREISLVQEGAMLVAELHRDTVFTRLLGAGELYDCPLNVPHNSYLFPGSVIHTVKLSCPPEGDWTACPALDPLCRALDPQALRAAFKLPTQSTV